MMIKFLQKMRQCIFVIGGIVFVMIGGGSSLWAQKENLAGTWIIDKTIIDKTIDGKTTTKQYVAGETISANALCPKKLTFDAENVMIEFSDDHVRQGSYTIDGDQIIANLPEAPYVYRYTLTGTSSIQLDYYVEYRIDWIHEAAESCSFIGHKE